MSTMDADVFDAFRYAGVAGDKATAAAQALNKRGSRVSAVETDVVLLKWMAGFNLGYCPGRGEIMIARLRAGMSQGVRDTARGQSDAVGQAGRDRPP